MRMTPENGTKKEPNKKPDSISSPSSCGCSAHLAPFPGFPHSQMPRPYLPHRQSHVHRYPPVLNIGYTPIIFLTHSCSPPSSCPDWHKPDCNIFVPVRTDAGRKTLCRTPDRSFDRTVLQFSGFGWVLFHLDRHSGEQNFLGLPL